MTSDQIIELHVKLHCAAVAMTGNPVTELGKQTYRNALQELVKLARLEYAQSVERDMAQATAAFCK